MAHVRDLGFHQGDLMDAIDAGDVRVQFHPEFPNLAIFNYTEDVQWRNKWNKVTLACRGLILDLDTGEIVARPWNKFFNLGQRDNEIEFDAPVEVTDKMDGSLGILYRQSDGKLAIATRGSFASDQAIHATRRLYDYDMNYFGIDDYTILFEIIYPDNRIVCNYDGMDELVLLGAVHKQHGHYYGPDIAFSIGWNGHRTLKFSYDTFGEAIGAIDRPGAEGIVIRSGNKMVKLKQQDYVELHRIVTNLSPKTIWEMLGDGKTIGDINAGIPDEFHKYVEDIGNSLLKMASEIKYQTSLEFNRIMVSMGRRSAVWDNNDYPEFSRKKFAERAKGSEHTKYLFLLLDGKSIDDVVWQSIKPRGDVKTLVKDEG